MDPKLKALIDKQGTEWVVTHLIERARGAEKDQSLAMLAQLAGFPMPSQKAAIDWWKTHKQRFSGRLPKAKGPDAEFDRLVNAAVRAETPAPARPAAVPSPKGGKAAFEPRAMPSTRYSPVKPERREPRVVEQPQPPRGAKVCSRCGHFSYGRKQTPGSIWIELILWLFFCLPGLIYSIYRLTARRLVCPACQSADLIPLDTPRGRELWAAQPQGTELHKERDFGLLQLVGLCVGAVFVLSVFASFCVEVPHGSAPSTPSSPTGQALPSPNKPGATSPNEGEHGPSDRPTAVPKDVTGGNPPPDAAKPFEILEISSRITESNETWEKWAWKLTLKNNLDHACLYDATIEFQDADGFIVDTDNEYNLALRAGAQDTFTGYDLLGAEISRKVAHVVAKVKRK